MSHTVTDSSYTERLKPVLDRVDPKWGSTSVTIGDGWIDLVLDLDRALARVAPDYVVMQVKEKFGTLRYYSDPLQVDKNAYATFMKAIREAEERSAHVCEECGQPGELRTERRWIRTLCDTHDTPEEMP